MGLFDGFVGSTMTLTPKVALAAGMVYVSAADGHIDANEKGDIYKVVPDDHVLSAAIKFVQRTAYPQYLEQATRLLTPAQKLCLILNAADMAMGDGFLAPQEQQMLNQMAQAFQIPDQYLAPHVQALMVKNNRSVF